MSTSRFEGDGLKGLGVLDWGWVRGGTVDDFSWPTPGSSGDVGGVVVVPLLTNERGKQTQARPGRPPLI
jgi:hypothetical protein